MDDDDLRNAVTALALIGMGWMAYKALDTSSQRRRFKEALRSGLREQGIGLVDVGLGRDADGELYWRVIANHPVAGLVEEHILVPAGATDTSIEALEEVLDVFYEHHSAA